jgi:hypothetical protein
MKYFILIDILLICSGCISTPLQQKRDKIISCVKDLRQNDISEKEAFEICRQVYGLGHTP